jgi:hypothetical protein
MPREAKRSKKVDTAIIVAVIGLVGTIIAALLSSPVLIKLMERTPETLQDEEPIFSQDFEGGSSSGFGFEVGEWDVIQDGTNHVLQGIATESSVPGAKAFFGPADFADGAIEFRFKFIQVGDLYFDFRYQEETGVYVFYFHPNAQSVVLAINVLQGNDWQFTELGAESIQPFTYQENIWYAVRLEVRESQFAAFLDGNRIMSASDTRLKNGRLRLVLAPDVVVYVDDVKVWSFDH